MADLVLFNGNVYTQDENRPYAQAVAIEGCRIEAVGNNEEMKALGKPGCRFVDLGGRCVLPGFNDTHCHVVSTGMEYEKVDLHDAVSVDDMIERGRKFIKERNLPEGTWVLGTGYDDTRFTVPGQPDRYALDRISVKHPIMFERICGHIAAANTLAFERTGFDENTKIEGEGGVIGKGADGHYNGVLMETALDVFRRRIDPPDLETVKRAILRTFSRAATYGVTSMQSDDAIDVSIETVMEAYRQIREEGKATVRVWEEVEKARPELLAGFLKLGLKSGDGDSYFKIGNIKLLTDGSLGAKSAYLREDYEGTPGNRGINVYTQPQLDEMVRLAHDAGLQVACHAIGDGAVSQCIHAIREAKRQDGTDLRDRIVHCQFADDGMLDEMASWHICADIQPPFVPTDLPWVKPLLGDREKTGYRWKSMIERGILAGGGSDSPVETFDPVWGIYCAVNRTDRDGLPEGGWHPEEKLSVEEAVRLYTVNGAYLSMEEAEKGRIRPGMLADMSVLDKDIYKVRPEDICFIKNVLTVMDGNIIYDRDHLAV